MTGPNGPAERTAVRLIFEYEGDEVRLVQQTPVDVAISGFDLPQEHVPGDHVEVRTADEGLLSRVPVRTGMSTSVEIFPEDPGDPITRTDLPVARGAFTVVVPVAEGADHVAVVRIRPGAPEASELARRTTEPVPGGPEVVELGTFPLERGGPR